jgi:hypothetical protein
LISTVSPALSLARSLSAAHDDMPGLAIAAAVTSSSPSGSGPICIAGATANSAIAPQGARGNRK